MYTSAIVHRIDFYRRQFYTTKTDYRRLWICGVIFRYKTICVVTKPGVILYVKALF
jgi:hypothetical protein